MKITLEEAIKTAKAIRNARPGARSIDGAAHELAAFVLGLEDPALEPDRPIYFEFQRRRYELIADEDGEFFVLRDHASLPLIIMPLGSNSLRVYPNGRRI